MRCGPDSLSKRPNSLHICIRTTISHAPLRSGNAAHASENPTNRTHLGVPLNLRLNLGLCEISIHAEENGK
jgi:hypothetical protein